VLVNDFWKQNNKLCPAVQADLLSDKHPDVFVQSCFIHGLANLELGTGLLQI
jgi:hypothetical protein